MKYGFVGCGIMDKVRKMCFHIFLSTFAIYKICELQKPFSIRLKFYFFLNRFGFNLFESLIKAPQWLLILWKLVTKSESGTGPATRQSQSLMLVRQSIHLRKILEISTFSDSRVLSYVYSQLHWVSYFQFQKKDLFADCDIVFACVSDPAAAKAIVFGEDGVINHVSAGKAYVDMSTVDAQTASEIGNAITKKGGRFLEAPVSGSKKPAEDGTVRNTLFFLIFH